MQNGLEIRLATIEDLDALERVGDALFDYPIKRNRAIEFLSDPRHHLVLALDQDEVVGMASGFHYVHPDKNPEMFINEVSVTTAYQNRGIGRALVKQLWEHAKKIGCREAWVGTEKSNKPARKCYSRAGGVPDDEPFIVYEFKEGIAG